MILAFVAFWSDRKKTRGTFVLGLMPIAMAGQSYICIHLLVFLARFGQGITTQIPLKIILGFILAIVADSNQVRYAALFLIGIGAYVSSFHYYL